ncbi:hypothetical protein J2X14_002977 [Pantoea alhagi]|uniref:hypothetical protein n=1 Tax=Mixta sp. BE291 TaxID=3158787 RepID=UPI0028553EA5|nr:hypothetical protein [Pantoea alhagi]
MNAASFVSCRSGDGGTAARFELNRAGPVMGGTAARFELNRAGQAKGGSTVGRHEAIHGASARAFPGAGGPPYAPPFAFP